MAATMKLLLPLVVLTTCILVVAESYGYYEDNDDDYFRIWDRVPPSVPPAVPPAPPAPPAPLAPAPKKNSAEDSLECKINFDNMYHINYDQSKQVNFQDMKYLADNADVIDWSKHPCRRNCSMFEPPRRCNYVFVVEELSSMGKACYDCPFNATDCFRPHCMPTAGVSKKIFTANRQLPGPTIEVCEGDNIVVEVQNKMLAQSTTIHWHGLPQKRTPYMDGVPYVTQCPILPGATFRYAFTVERSGTYFWHSHMGGQRSDGLTGALIIHPPAPLNPHRKLYDSDHHHMIVQDWRLMDSDSIHTRTFHSVVDRVPETLLINGRGRFENFTRAGLSRNATTPAAYFQVSRNKRYRFRMIDAGSENCPIRMSIDGHKMLIISLDSNDIEPVSVDAITIWPGERADFVLAADQPPGNYWIRYRGFGRCQVLNTTTGTSQVAILTYSEVETKDPVGPVGFNVPQDWPKMRVLNPYNAGDESPQRVNLSIPRLNSIARSDPSLKKVADQQVYLSFDVYPIDNHDYHRHGLYGYRQVVGSRQRGSLQLNHISLKLQQFPLLTQYQMIEPGMLCNRSTIDLNRCRREHCACTHVIQLKLNSVVELVLVDGGTLGVVNHPLHLHGHFFRVVAMENLQGNVTIERVKQLDREGKIKRRLDRAPIKDTLKTPGGGYSIVRFHANNPGYWFFHCHFEPHMHVGMALVVKVGEHEDFPLVPRNFPKCGPFIPDEY